jgi:hypothetical protein
LEVGEGRKAQRRTRRSQVRNAQIIMRRSFKGRIIVRVWGFGGDVEEVEEGGFLGGKGKLIALKRGLYRRQIYVNMTKFSCTIYI